HPRRRGRGSITVTPKSGPFRSSTRRSSTPATTTEARSPPVACRTDCLCQSRRFCVGLRTPGPTEVAILVPFLSSESRFSQRWATAVSGGGRDELVESFGGSIPCEGHAGASVEFDGDVVELLLAVFGEVGAIGEVLADEAVPVFVGAALPW